MRERRERSTIDLNDSHSTKRRHVDNVIDVTAYDDSILVTPALNDSYNINTTDMMTSAIVSDGDDDDGEDALFDRVQPQSRLDTTCNWLLKLLLVNMNSQYSYYYSILFTLVPFLSSSEHSLLISYNTSWQLKYWIQASITIIGLQHGCQLSEWAGSTKLKQQTDLVLQLWSVF